MGDNRRPRYSVAGEYYQIFLWSGASEETEFFTEKMVANEKRSVHKLSGAVQKLTEPIESGVTHQVRDCKDTTGKPSQNQAPV